jgi:hypothetical protein
LFFGEWNETRKINTPVLSGGKERYYSTGDLYPWWNVNKRGPTKQECHTSRNVTKCINVTNTIEFGTPSWDISHGANRGIDWLAEMLHGALFLSRFYTPSNQPVVLILVFNLDWQLMAAARCSVSRLAADRCCTVLGL